MSPTVSPPRLAALASKLRRIVMGPRFRTEAASHPGGRQLLVDVSTIARSDVRTGIQRVVRAMLGQLVATEIPGLTVQPVFASRNHGFCKAAFHPDGTLARVNGPSGRLQAVTVAPGDIFLGLDLAAQTLPAVEGELARWRRRGVSINIVVYDLLPATRPDWFSRQLVRNFDRWLGVIARQSDRCICISGPVAHALAEQLAARKARTQPAILTIPLGSDIGSSFPSRGLPDDVAAVRKWVRQGRTLLTVGTIEPRKGHDRLLGALDQIWRTDPESDIALLVVGRAGWSTGELQQRIKDHPEYGKRLVWLDQASDELLSELYRSCVGLVAASHQEGFGLPLIEASAHGSPVLARDLPVFRDIGGTMFDFFDNDDPIAFADCIKEWLAAARRRPETEINCLPRWADSAAALKTHLGLVQSSTGSAP